MKPIRSHSFLGRIYRIRFHHRIPPDALGMCEHPSSKNKTIHIRPNLDVKQLVETVVDESLHACFWSLDNEEVDEAATDIVRLLFRMFDIKPKDDLTGRTES